MEKRQAIQFGTCTGLKLPVTDIFCFLQGTTAPTSCLSCSFSSCFLKLLCSASFETELLKIKFDAFHPNTALIQCLRRRKLFTPLAWVTGIKSNQSQCETSLLMPNVCQVKSSQVTFIYIALLTIQIVTKQLHNIKMGK